jgi:hypothetical protein
MNREYGNTIMVRMNRDVHDRLCKLKIIPQEPLNDCILRLIIIKEKQNGDINISKIQETQL